MSGQKRRLWVTGARGLIGNALLRQAEIEPGPFEARGLGRMDLDLTDPRAVEAMFQSEQPDGVIHCAAMSKSPACEADPQQAWAVNVEASVFLAGLCGERPFVFLSTDLVFDGMRGWYSENDAVNPRSVYAETKAAAEERIRKQPGHLIIRTSLNGGRSPSGDRGFNEEMKRAWGEQRVLTLFMDEYRCPIAAIETARAVWELTALGATGTCHVAGTERLSRWEIGQLLAARCPHLSPRIEKSSLAQYLGPPRSPDTSLDCSKAEQWLGRKLPRFSEWLALQDRDAF